MTALDHNYDTKTGVHPFFSFLQAEYDPATRFRGADATEQDLFIIPQVSMNQFDKKRFYRYFMTQNAPLHVVDGASDWKAILQWNPSYLQQKLGNLKLMTRTIQTSVRDAKQAETPYGEWVFDYTDGQHVHNEEMSLASYLEKRTLYKTKVFEAEYVGNWMT